MQVFKSQVIAVLLCTSLQVEPGIRCYRSRFCSERSKSIQFRYTFDTEMTLELFRQIFETYRRHGWELQRVLLRPDTRAAIENEAELRSADLRDDQIDALWFARPSHADREAWELRLMAEQPYALFEAFEPDESESVREEKRQQMEARMREYAAS